MADFKYLVEVPGWRGDSLMVTSSEENVMNKKVTVSLSNGYEYEGDVVDTPNTMIFEVIKSEEDKQKIVGLKFVGRVNETIKCLNLHDFAVKQPAQEKEELNGKTLLSSLGKLRLNEIENLANLMTSENGLQVSIDHDSLHFTNISFANSVPFVPSLTKTQGILRRKRKVLPWNRCFSDSEVPKEPPAEILSRARRLYGSDYERMKRLFEEDRPIWLRSALTPRLTHLSLNEFRSILPAVAYFFMDGPWRSCWVRYGFDPRTDPSSAAYQVLETRSTGVQRFLQAISPEAQNSINIIPSKSEFDGIQVNLFLYQFQYCDLTYPPLQSIISDQKNKSEECTKVEGWYTNGTSSRLRKIVKRRWTELVMEKDPGIMDRMTMEVEQEEKVPEDTSTTTQLPHYSQNVFSQINDFEEFDYYDDDNVDTDKNS